MRRGSHVRIAAVVVAVAVAVAAAVDVVVVVDGNDVMGYDAFV